MSNVIFLPVKKVDQSCDNDVPLFATRPADYGDAAAALVETLLVLTQYLEDVQRQLSASQSI